MAQKKNAHGWYSKYHNPLGKTGGQLSSEGIRDKTEYVLYHYDGREWRGLKVDFAKEFNRKLHFQNVGGDCAGWHLNKEDAEQFFSRRKQKCSKNSAARGLIAGSRNPNADPNKYEWIVLSSGTCEVATKLDIKQKFGLSSTDVCNLFSGKQKTAKGVALVKQETLA